MVGPLATDATDFTAKVEIAGLPAGTRVHYRTRFGESPWLIGSLKTAPREPNEVRIAWSGDTNGQGFGIDAAHGGMPAYTSLLAQAPDLFVHVGDSIYADNPIPKEIELPEGRWNNLVDPVKDHVAETLADFRGAHRYPRLSAEVRALSAAVPLLPIWDDHEVHNNWFPGETLDDPRYRSERRVDELARYARRAMFEYTPTLRSPASAPMYRVVEWGPLASIFLLDGRTYRTPNEPPGEAMLGAAQCAWLLEQLTHSRAIWKIIACDMPIALPVSEPGKTKKRAFDGWANESGPPQEREVELARLLSSIKARGIKNAVWITADVHYCAVHRFDPDKAVYRDFDPFYELVAGPMHARTLPRKPTDDTFGPEVEWSSSSWDTFDSPLTGAQFFGLLAIQKETLSVRFIDARGRELHRHELRVG